MCCKEVGQELGLPVVDLWSSMQEEEVSWRKGKEWRLTKTSEFYHRFHMLHVQNWPVC